MWSFLLCVIVAVGVTTASDQQVENREVESSRTKRLYLTTTQTGLIQHGYDAANSLFEKMDKLNFAGVAGDLVSGMSSFLGAVGPAVGILLTIFTGPSATDRRLKDLLNKVENGFSRMDVKFDDLKRQVAFVATQVQFNTLEANIKTLQAEYNTLKSTTNRAGYNFASTQFISIYENTYQDAGRKLAEAVTHGGVLTGGLFNDYLTHSTYDRKQTEQFMLRTLNLLIRASSLEMAYQQLKHSPNAGIKRTEWIGRFTAIQKKMTKIDGIAVSNYHTQAVTDINNFGTMHPKGSLSSTDFVNQLYSQLSTKYYWRDWLVYSSSPYDHWKSVFNACEYNQHDYHGRTIAAASVLKTKSSHASVYSLHASLKLYITSAGRPGSGHHYRYTCADCNTAWGQLPASKGQCGTYTAAGVICTKSTDIAIKGAPGRYVTRNPHGANMAFLFG